MSQQQIAVTEDGSIWRDHWERLTDDELAIVEGRRELLVAKELEINKSSEYYF